MNIPPSEAERMSLHDYEELLWNWNDVHDTDVQAPDPQKWAKMRDMINADPRLVN